jgi:hypothetical protein
MAMPGKRRVNPEKIGMVNKKMPLIVVFILGLICFSTIAYSTQDKMLAFQKKVIVDSQGFGMEAFRVLVPEGWDFKGAVSWDFNKIPPEASMAFTITSPDGGSVVEQFPYSNFFWSQDPSIQNVYDQADQEIRPPLNAIEFIKRIFLPHVRPNASNLRILESMNLPELAKQAKYIIQYHMRVFHQISPFQFDLEIHADAGRVKVKYSEGDKTMIEDITVSISYIITHMPCIYGGIVPANNWVPVVKSFRAPANELNEKVRIFKIITYSQMENPAWSLANIKLAASTTRDQLCQKRGIFNRMQQIRQTQLEVDDMIMDIYKKRNMAYDRIFDNYREAIRDVETYVDLIKY